jgi:hypothetical protein
VSNWDEIGRVQLHVCRDDPYVFVKLGYFANSTSITITTTAAGLINVTKGPVSDFS